MPALKHISRPTFDVESPNEVHHPDEGSWEVRNSTGTHMQLLMLQADARLLNLSPQGVLLKSQKLFRQSINMDRITEVAKSSSGWYWAWIHGWYQKRDDKAWYDQSVYTNWTKNIQLKTTIHSTLMMTSTQVVKTSVTTTENSPSQDYTPLDDQTTLLHVTPGFKPFIVL